MFHFKVPIRVHGTSETNNYSIISLIQLTGHIPILFTSLFYVMPKIKINSL